MGNISSTAPVMEDSGCICLSASDLSGKATDSGRSCGPLPADCYSIVASDRDLLLRGGSPRAVLRAVYDLLERLGCRYLSPDYDFMQGLRKWSRLSTG